MRAGCFRSAEDGIARDFETGYERLFYFSDDAEVPEYLALARALHEIKPFDAVWSFNDNAQYIAITINQALGLPCHLTADVLQLVYDKNRMRQALHEAGLDDTPHAVVNGPEDVADFAKSAGYPLILKPVDATGSRGISILRDDDDISHAFARLAEDAGAKTAIAERFLEGKELSVEAFSENGHHQVIAITEKFKDPDNFIEIGHVVPAPIESEQAAAVREYICRVLDCLGVTDGPTHTEVMLTDAGPVIIETHTRPGGDRIDKLVEIATGVDIFKLAARQIMGESVLTDTRPPEAHRYGAVWFALPEMTRPHKVRAVNNLSKAESCLGFAK